MSTSSVSVYAAPSLRSSVCVQASCGDGAGCITPTNWRWDFCLQLALPVIVAVSYFSPIALRSAQAKLGIRPISSLVCLSRNSAASDPLVAKPTMKAMRNAAVSRTLGIINILYLPISRYSISIFFCIQLRDGQSVLKMFPDVACSSTQYYVFLCLGCLGTAACTPLASCLGVPKATCSI